jgi:hypothetical protein
MNWEIGQRVVTPSGDIGLIEEIERGQIDHNMVRVRLRTPDDEPSCLSSWCFPEQLRDGTRVVPMPRSKAWKAESDAFCSGIRAALLSAGIHGG